MLLVRLPAHARLGSDLVLPIEPFRLRKAGIVEVVRRAAGERCVGVFDGVLVGARDQRFLAIAMVGSLAVLAACGAAVAWSSTGLWGVWLTVVVFIASRVAVLTPRLNTVLASA